MKKRLLLLAPLIVFLLGFTVFFTQTAWRMQVLGAIKAKGYLPYTSDEAVSLAYTRCTSCHTQEKIVKYCARCGPPFIIVVNVMKKHIALAQKQKRDIPQLSDAEAVTIVQVWNATIGNWDGDWRKEDLARMLKGDHALLALLETPIEQREIEMALKGKLAPGAYTDTKMNSGMNQ